MRFGRALTFAVAACLVACETVPDLVFEAPDASRPDDASADGGAADAAADAVPVDGGDPFDAAATADDADNPSAPGPPSVDSQPNTCPRSPPPNVSLCCGRVPCISPGKGCQDNCNACRTACPGQICCVRSQKVVGCADTTAGCGK